MRGHRGYNICPWLKNGKHEICGKSCREEYCKDHRHKIRNRSRIPRPCLGCGIGVRSQIQLCRGCGREKERQRRAKTRVEPAQHRVCAENCIGVRDKCDTVYFTENEFCFGLRDWVEAWVREKGQINEMSVPEHVVDFMKNMNPKQLVDFLLPNKTSSGN